MNIDIKQEIKIKIGEHEFSLTKEEAMSIRDKLDKILGCETNNLREIEKYIPKDIPDTHKIPWGDNKRDNDLWPLPTTPYYPEKPPYNIPEVWCGFQEDPKKLKS